MGFGELPADLAASLDAFLAIEPASLGDRLLGERAGALMTLSHRIDAALAATVADAETRGMTGTTVSRAGQTGPWLAEQTAARIGRAEQARQVRRAAVATALPLIAALHAGGEVSTAFLDAAGAALRRLPCEALASWDALLAGESRDLDPADIPKLLAHVRIMVDPDRANNDAANAAARSELHINPFGSEGSWAIRGTLHGLEGKLFATLINHYAQPRGADDSRSPGQRRAEALLQICRIAERSTGDPDFVSAPHGQPAHLVVLATHATATAQPGAPGGQAEDTVVDPGRIAAMRCNTTPDLLLHDIPGESLADRVAPITDSSDGSADGVAAEDAEAIRRILAGLIPWPAAHRIEPLAYARALRTANRAQWAALVARDGHCVIPGCTRDASWCEAHHCREYDADNGNTDLINMALVCWDHHTWLHRRNLHLHPPWCACDPCIPRKTSRIYKPGTWHVNGCTPEIHPPGRSTSHL